ncbi:MAG: hypothetical protein ACK59R_13515 [Pseudomonadota bacterium]
MDRQGFRPGYLLGAAMLAAALALCAGCAGAPRRADGETAVDPAAMGRMGRMPLSDFNLGGDDIPDVLLRAVADTYALPVPAECAALAIEIAAIDAVLGPDLDVLKAADREDDFMRGAVVGALRGMIPYHGLSGLISGARQRDRRIAEAVAAGAVRRGFLKGYGGSIGCAPPAAPLRLP